MKIIVVGCGKIGGAVVSNLVSEGHDIVAVDTNPAVVEEMSNLYDVMCVCGNGADYDTLSEAGVENAEMLIAVTGSDELNMLCCFFANKMGANHTVARIRNPEFNDRNLGFMKQQLGISLVINPELLAAREMFNILKFPTALNIEEFSHRSFEMIEIRVKSASALAGLSLTEVRKKYPGNYLITTVGRSDGVYIPDGNFVLQAGDRIGIMARITHLHKFLKGVGVLKAAAKSTMILGASTTAFYLAQMLTKSGNTVKIIDKDRARCEFTSEALPDAVIIMGDGTEQDLLLEEGIRNTDAFVSLTGMDEENILISFFAVSQDVPKVITKVNRDELGSMAEKLGLDCIISPKNIVSNVVLRYARALQNSIDSNIETLYKVMGGQAEVIEFNVLPDFKYVNIPLRDMKLENNTLIAGIIRGRKAIIPSGDDVILPSDKVIIVSSGKHINELSDIMQ